MKLSVKVIVAVIVLCMVFTVVSCGGKTITPMTEGTYTQTAYPDLVVEVKLSKKAIEQVSIKNFNEIDGIANSAIQKVSSDIVKNQSLAVDIVAGASMTSAGIISTVKDAIIAAGGKPEEFGAMSSDMVDDNMDSDMADDDMVDDSMDSDILDDGMVDDEILDDDALDSDNPDLIDSEVDDEAMEEAKMDI